MNLRVKAIKERVSSGALVSSSDMAHLSLAELQRAEETKLEQNQSYYLRRAEIYARLALALKVK